MRQIIAMEHSNMAISQDEREFFVALGIRIAKLRKESNLTQVQLAGTLGISQPTMNAYEWDSGAFRCPHCRYSPRRWAPDWKSCSAKQRLPRASAALHRSGNSKSKLLRSCRRRSNALYRRCWIPCWLRPVVKNKQLKKKPLASGLPEGVAFYLLKKNMDATCRIGTGGSPYLAVYQSPIK